MSIKEKIDVLSLLVVLLCFLVIMHQIFIARLSNRLRDLKLRHSNLLDLVTVLEQEDIQNTLSFNDLYKRIEKLEAKNNESKY